LYARLFLFVPFCAAVLDDRWTAGTKAVWDCEIWDEYLRDDPLFPPCLLNRAARNDIDRTTPVGPDVIKTNVISANNNGTDHIVVEG
jgi:hypothetical protein